jgi:polyhydroxyalkanoate synthesis regulator phasin
MAMFKGFSTTDVITLKPRFMIAVLSQQLVLRNQAIEAQAEEIKHLREEVKELKESKE